MTKRSRALQLEIQQLAQGNVVQLSAMCKVDLCHVRLPNVGSGLVRPKFSKPELVGPVQVRFEP